MTQILIRQQCSFAVKTPEIKSSFIVEKQENNGQSLLTFEASDELDLSDILIENIPNEINVISIPNVENFKQSHDKPNFK